MKKIIFKILNYGKEPSSDFSRFVYTASSSRKKRIVKEAIRRANEEQKALVDKYDRKYSGGY